MIQTAVAPPSTPAEMFLFLHINTSAAAELINEVNIARRLKTIKLHCAWSLGHYTRQHDGDKICSVEDSRKKYKISYGVTVDEQEHLVIKPLQPDKDLQG
jgi:hypothetical protein